MANLFHCGHGTLTLLWVGAAIAAVVCVLMLYSIARFRKTTDSGAATFAHHNLVEVIWATIPILILIITAVPAIKILVVSEARCNSSSVQPSGK